MSKKRKCMAIGAVVTGLLLVYVSTWCFRRQLGIIRPMANMLYFHYAPQPESWQDRALYAAYYPLYKASRAAQDHLGVGAREIHWSDRKLPVLPGPEEIAGGRQGGGGVRN